MMKNGGIDVKKWLDIENRDKNIPSNRFQEIIYSVVLIQMFRVLQIIFLFFSKKIIY